MIKKILEKVTTAIKDECQLLTGKCNQIDIVYEATVTQNNSNKIKKQAQRRATTDRSGHKMIKRDSVPGT